MTAISPASDRVTVDRPSLMAPADQLTLVDGRLHEILISRWRFRRHLPPRSLAAVPPAVDDAVDLRRHQLVAGAKTGTLSNVE